jgi:hypothetical protein
MANSRRLVRPNPLNLKPPTAVTEMIEATDPLHPGMSIALFLTARPDRGTQLRIDELALEYQGRFLESKEGEVEAVFLTDGQRVTITRSLCFIIATLVVMEQSYWEGKEDVPILWDFEEWAVLSASAPTAFDGVVSGADRLQGLARTERGNSGGQSATGSGQQEPPTSNPGA